MIRRVLASAAVCAATAGSGLAQQPIYTSAFATPAAAACAPVAVPAPAAVSAPAVPCPAIAAAAPAAEPPRFWGSADYLFFFLKDSSVPVTIATTGPPAGRGILGNPLGAGVPILGNSTSDHGLFNGGRLTLGGWLNEHHDIGVEGSAFLLENLAERTARFGGAGGYPVLSRPFFDTTINAQNARVLALPDSFTGAITTKTETRFWGANFDILARLVNDKQFTLDATTGFRFLSLEESYSIRDTATVLTNGVTAFNSVGLLAGATTSSTDRFATQNRFYGGSLGLRLGYETGPVSLSVTGKVSLGAVHESVVRSGTTTLSAGTLPLPATVPGGLYNLGSNIGRLTHDEFAAVPEVNLRVSVRVVKGVSVSAGYNYLYMSRAVRPGDQISQTVNPTLIPTSPTLGVPFGPRLPSAGITQSDFWAHGVNVGLSVAY